jgi:hypothetical protein
MTWKVALPRGGSDMGILWLPRTTNCPAVLETLRIETGCGPALMVNVLVGLAVPIVTVPKLIEEGAILAWACKDIGESKEVASIRAKDKDTSSFLSIWRIFLSVFLEQGG